LLILYFIQWFWWIFTGVFSNRLVLNLTRVQTVLSLRCFVRYWIYNGTQLIDFNNLFLYILLLQYKLQKAMLSAMTFLGGYRIVYKKVPQFVVPDLTGFEVLNPSACNSLQNTSSNCPVVKLLFTWNYTSCFLCC